MPKILSRPSNRQTESRMRAFLRIYQQTASVSEAAARAGVHRTLHYRRLESDPKYREAFKEAERQASQLLEDEAIRRALVGVRRPLMYNGKPVKLARRILYHTQYSDMLLVKLLQRFRPKLYRDHVVAEQTGPVDLVQRLQAARERLRAAG
jgi:hypothetical protein